MTKSNELNCALLMSVPLMVQAVTDFLNNFLIPITCSNKSNINWLFSVPVLLKCETKVPYLES